MRALVLLLFSLSLTAHAQTEPFKYNYTVTCGATKPIIEFLSKTQKEELTWTGLDISDGSVYSLWQDAEGNWTLLKKTPQVACILGVGTKPKVI
jgi:hypothetical protein